ncbi:MAG: hypothetical protein K2X48_04210 [Chitinophagaceae bacterium]|nr:hypothetical protein [Chitinophagaceae bacterium]
MQKKPSLSIVFLIFALIVGGALRREFDTTAMKFKNTGLAIVYAVTFLFSVYILLKDLIKQPEK